MLLKTENLSKAYESRKKGEPVFWAAREENLDLFSQFAGERFIQTFTFEKNFS